MSERERKRESSEKDVGGLRNIMRSCILVADISVLVVQEHYTEMTVIDTQSDITLIC